MRSRKECGWGGVIRHETKNTPAFRDEEQQADPAKKAEKEWPGREADNLEEKEIRKEERWGSS